MTVFGVKRLRPRLAYANLRGEWRGTTTHKIDFLGWASMNTIPSRRITVFCTPSDRQTVKRYNQLDTIELRATYCPRARHSRNKLIDCLIILLIPRVRVCAYLLRGCARAQYYTRNILHVVRIVRNIPFTNTTRKLYILQPTTCASSRLSRSSGVHKTLTTASQSCDTI